jgi:hypothetical protein
MALAATPLCAFGLSGHRGVFRSGAWADHRKDWGNFDPKINRHTGRPHEHKREIARRKRQAARA